MIRPISAPARRRRAENVAIQDKEILGKWGAPPSEPGPGLVHTRCAISAGCGWTRRNASGMRPRLATTVCPYVSHRRLHDETSVVLKSNSSNPGVSKRTLAEPFSLSPAWPYFIGFFMTEVIAQTTMFAAESSLAVNGTNVRIGL
jgi:hypothetical protein